MSKRAMVFGPDVEAALSRSVAEQREENTGSQLTGRASRLAEEREREFEESTTAMGTTSPVSFRPTCDACYVRMQPASWSFKDNGRKLSWCKFECPQCRTGLDWYFTESEGL